jgi:hypothetical protein
MSYDPAIRRESEGVTLSIYTLWLRFFLSRSGGCPMNNQKLEAYVKTSFNMPMQDFIKQMVQVKGLFDREIAEMLNISIRSVWNIRKEYGLKKTGISLRRFEKRYGPNAMAEFKAIIKNPSSSLADVGRHFGFSRENARQIYKKIYGKPYSETYKKKVLIRREKADSHKFNSGRLIHFKEVKNKIADIGLNPEIKFKSNSYSLMTENGFKVAVMHTSNLIDVGNKKYFQVNPVGKLKQDCDFFILACLNNGNRTYYVIPNKDMPKNGTMIPALSNDANGKYSRLRDAWHLLAAVNT